MTIPEQDPDGEGRILQFPCRDTPPPEIADTDEPSTEIERADGPVLDGELVDEEEYQRSRARRIADIVVRQAKVVHDHDATNVAKAVGRPVLRHAVTIGQGHASWAARAMAAASHAHIREQIRLAQMTGDSERLALWIDRLRAERDARQNRLRNLPGTLLQGLKSLLVAVTVLAGVLVAAGLVFQLLPGGMGWLGWWRLLGDIAGVAGIIVTVAVYIVLWGAVPAWLWAAHREGQRSGAAPKWLLTPEQQETASTAEINEDLITAALAKVGISELTKYLKNGGKLEFVVPCREQGGGTYCQVRLPMGTNASQVLPSKTVELLAGNLGRHLHEVWPQRDPKADARVLDLWIADKGVMDKPAPPSPMMVDTFGAVDIFTDQMPWGVTMRGDQVLVQLLQRHWLVAGVSKQGKTSAFRALALWLAHDPTVEIQLSDLKGDGDWSMFAGLATIMIEGQSDENEIRTAVMLEKLVAEMRRRYEAKRLAGIVGNITREMSRKQGSGFHPIYAIADEIQIGYASLAADDAGPVGGKGKEARLKIAAKRLHDQARAVNIHLLQATQRPSDNDGIPAVVREGAHVRASLHVPNLAAAKMVLGDVAEMGARPQDLRSELDAGTVVLTGAAPEAIPRGQACQIVRTHYISTKEAWALAARAKEIRVRAGRVFEAADLDDSRDLLADLKHAMAGAEKVRSTTILQRLKEEWPDTYMPWSAQKFADALRPHGIEIRSGRVDGAAGQRHVHEADVLAAMTGEQTSEEDDDDA